VKRALIKADYQKNANIMRKAIRAKCLDCMNGSKDDCEIMDCPLYAVKGNVIKRTRRKNVRNNDSSNEQCRG
jgi:hypothetical protein